MSFEALGKSILFHTRNHLAIRGNSQTRDEIISTFAGDMREFLSKSKSVGLLPEDIVEFYKKHFPKINIEVNKMSAFEKNSILI